METLYYVLVGILSLVLGYIIGYFVKIKVLQRKAEELIKKAQDEAEIVKQQKTLEAKEHFLLLKSKFDEDTKQREEKVLKQETRLKQFEVNLNATKDDLQKKLKVFEIKRKEVQTLKENLTIQIEAVDKKKSEMEQLYLEQAKKLESIAGISPQQAKEQIIESMKEEAKAESQAYIADIIEQAKLSATEEAKKIVIKTIQRVGSDVAANNSITVFHIENDEIKGRIIGREGRNIRTLEAATGVEIIVDDTPEAIVLSSFDPLRREVARLALNQLVLDGRIHPARIEDIVAKTKKQLEEEILEVGKKTCLDLGIHNMHPQLMRFVGKMKYRSSYGQNLLQHSIEVAKLCGIMAAELGLNPKIAKRAGLLHDIGKVPEEETETPHALYGMQLAEKHNEKQQVCNAIGSHHDEVEMDNLYSPLIQVCDAISGARPGARREIVETYAKRMQDLEQLAMSYKGVTKSFAIQAGRELRVIVSSDDISDKESDILAYEIAHRIQKDMTYPGQIKVTVIREKRAINYAK